MKTGFFGICLLLFCLVQMPPVFAGDSSEKRTEADQLYLAKEFKNAKRIYFKLAKDGDHYSQGRVAHMFANGEGGSVDLADAYAWSVLAEQGGDSFVAESSAQLLERVVDKNGARKTAEKLIAKYGQQALLAKAQRQAESEAARRSGSSMGSNLSR